MNNWSGVDFFIFLIFFVNTMLGMSRGAAREIISMMCVSVALIFTIKFTVPLTNFINSSPGIQDVIDSTITKNFMSAIGADPLTTGMLYQVAYCLSILICFVGIFATGEAVLNFTGFVEMFTFPYAFLNRKLGAALGATRGYILSVIFILILQHLFISHPLSNSYFINLFQGTANKLDSLIASQQPEQYKTIYEDKNLYNEKNIYQTVPQQQQ